MRLTKKGLPRQGHKFTIRQGGESFEVKMVGHIEMSPPKTVGGPPKYQAILEYREGGRDTVYWPLDPPPDMPVTLTDGWAD